MTDLISREAAIALLQDIPDDDEGDSYAGGYNEAKLDCIKALTNMPSAEVGLPYVKFDEELLATLRNCKGAVITIQEKP